MEEFTQFLEKMANVLGVTIDKVWEILLKQAFISGMLDIVIYSCLVLSCTYVYRFIKAKAGTFNMHEAENVSMWTLFLIWSVIVGCIILLNINSTVAALFNPEYWALNKLICKLMYLRK